MSTACYIHPSNEANTSCEECERPICAADHRSITISKSQGSRTIVEKKLVCPSCKETISAKQEKLNRTGNIIGLILIVVLIGITIFALTNPDLLGI